MKAKIGDLGRLSTPDGDDGKLLLIVDIKEMKDRGKVFIGIVVGETQPHVYLPWEVDLFTRRETFISQ